MKTFVPEMGRLLTAQEVADWLNCELQTVRKWTSQGRIPCVKLSRRAVRFSEAAIKEWIQSKTAEGNGKGGDKAPQNKNYKIRCSRTFAGRNDDIDRIVDRTRKEVLGKQ